MHVEESLFQAFVVSTKRQRYIELLASKHGREKIVRSLDHFKDLDPRFCRHVESADIPRILRGLGAPSVCYIVSSDSNLDGREMSLPDALTEVIGRGQGTFISCIPGKLAYFEGEEPHERYICHRER